MGKTRFGKLQTSPVRSQRRPISGPAIVVLILTLAAIWFGSRALGQTATVSVDTAPMQSTETTPELAQPPAKFEATPPTVTPPSTETVTQAAAASSSTAAPAGMPDGFPAGIPVPQNATLIKATAAGKDGDKTYIAAYQVTAKPTEASASYQQQLKDAGFEVHAVLGNANSDFFGAQKDALSISVSVGADQQAEGKTNLTITTSQ